MKKKLKKIFKVFVWIIGSFFGLILLLILALQIPYVQNLVKEKAVSYLENKIHTEVSIGSIEIGLPKKIIITDFYFEDQSNDTLLSGKKLDVDVSLFKLLSNSLEINHVYLDGVTAKINKNKDSVFNFDYIIKAFASEPDTTSSKPMHIAINDIHIKKSKFSYNDGLSKNDINVKIGDFETSFDEFDLEHQTFDIPKIKVNDFQLVLNQGLVEALDKADKKIKQETNSQPLKLKLNEIDLSKIAISYKDETSKLATEIAFQTLKTTVQTIDLENQKIEIDNFLLEETNGQLEFGKLITQTKEKQENSNSKSWSFSANSLIFKKVNFAYHNYNLKERPNGLDPNHLVITNLNLASKDLFYSTSKISGEIENIAFIEKSGFVLNTLKTQFEYAEKSAFLKHLEINTPQTKLKNENILLEYPSIASITNNPETIQIKADFTNSSLGVKDILLLVPSLATTTPFNTNKNSIINFTANVNGRLDELYINQLKVSGISATKIAITGSILGLPNVDKTYFDLTINNLQSTAKDMNTLLPKGSVPNSILLPEQFSAKGNFIGFLTNFETKINLESSFGNALVDASFDQTKINNEQYKVIATLDNFDIGKLIQNKELGKVTLETTFEGNSLDPQKANAKADLKIIEALFNNYKYTNLIVNGKINNGNFTVVSKSNDPNLTYNLESSGDLDGKHPKAKLNLKVDLIDLNKLNLHAGPLKMKGDITADFDNLDIDNLNGTLQATQFLVALEKEQFPLDTITIRAIATAEKDSIILKSQFANININGNYKLSTINKSLKNSIAHYFNSNEKSTNDIPANPQRLQFDIYIKEEEILKKIIPDLKEMSAITITGLYNAENDSIVINGSIPNLNYAGTAITATNFNLYKEAEALVYNLQIGKIKNNDFIIPKTNVSGAIENNQIDYQVSIVDPKEVEKYAFSGKYNTENAISKINLNPEKLILNYENWSIDNQNTISMNQNGINIHNFFLSNNGNSLKIQSENNSFSAPIAIDLKDFKLQSLTNIVNSNYEFGGKVNGKTTIKNITESPVFLADIDIENFKIKNDTVGNISLKIDNTIADTYTANIELSGNNNAVQINGDYKTKTSIVDVAIDFDKLQMQSIQAFTSGNLKESEGYLNGKLVVTGNATNPNIIGNLKFNQVGFTIVPLNSRFKLINDAIDFNSNTIAFKNFKFKDENENDLKINGTINSSNYTNLGFDLNVIADNFRAVNSEAKDNDLFYGALYLDNNINIKGDFENPIVNGNIKINKDTQFTIVLPQENPSVADREGIVTFIDQDQPVLIEVEDPMKKITSTNIKGINASVNIEIDKEAEISIIIDKANGDFLKLKGEAKLNGGIDSSGKTTLTGKYEFTGGSYEMNFNLIKRKFDIKPGSYILWTGEPTMANVSITAIYKTDIAPIDLVNDQLTTTSTEDRNRFKQKIPFETQLNMTGELLQPEINFDIVLPEGNNDVAAEVINTTQAKLTQIRQQEDVLNKQVFAVLLLNRFIGENPFQSESGGVSAGYLAKQSASRILSEQLNQIAGDLIQGFELNFDLEASEAYSSGQKEDKTDLNVGISKELLDDRLKISVGSSFGIEGGQNENEQATTIAGDVAAEYLLTKDGRYKLKAYRKNNYQVALQGQVIETGVAFIITMNYNTFKELFQKNKEGN